MNYIAYDLGTSGVKASLHDEHLGTLARSVIEYKTFYPQNGYHEQRPEDWWNGIADSTKRLLEMSGVAPDEIACVALSGHSCVAVPLDAHGELLTEYVPIWSDMRARDEAEKFFKKIDNDFWYMTTGNGFPAPCYALFKLMWYQKHCPTLFAKISKFVGSKDYINFKLAGVVCTDYSYASGLGVYDLKEKKIRADFLEAAGIPLRIFPEVVPSHTIIGHVTKDAAQKTGLNVGTPVACGGVDNACMALGAVGPESGCVYTSLGSSAWIPVNSHEPILDTRKRPYVFAHIQEDMFTSAFSIFAGGSSLQWAKDVLCEDLRSEADIYRKIEQLAAASPIGSNGILFNPSLAGGTAQDKSVNIHGAYIGLSLATTRSDMLRAVLEGVALNLKTALDYLSQKVPLTEQILFCGGGSKMAFWMQMFADVFNMEVVKTNIDQDAASIGAAAICARALGAWSDYKKVPALHRIEQRFLPQAESSRKYEQVFHVFNHVSDELSALGDYMIAHATK
ncbi:MAG: FGGY-family carbohydrate kinase [Clostridia bacterium]